MSVRCCVLESHHLLVHKHKELDYETMRLRLFQGFCNKITMTYAWVLMRDRYPWERTLQFTQFYFEPKKHNKTASVE